VDGGQELIEVAQVVLAELAGRIALRFESSGDGAGLGGQSGLSARLADRSPVMKFARPAVQLASA
jgi:hypothetical protein